MRRSEFSGMRDEVVAAQERLELGAVRLAAIEHLVAAGAVLLELRQRVLHGLGAHPLGHVLHARALRLENVGRPGSTARTA